MCKRRLLLARVLLLGCCTVAAYAQQHLTPAQATDHVGEVATICGKVASLHLAATSKGQPTFINLDQPYPRQVFAMLIWGSDRPQFGDVEHRFTGKTICVTGTISAYRGVPEIVARSADQIVVQGH